MNRKLSRALLVLGGTLAFASPAIAKKKKKDKAAAPEPAAASATPDVPNDGNSKKYAQKLLETEIKDFSPSDGAGAKFEYTSMKFAGDNTWSAEGYVEIADERMECTEKGKWTMEAATSATEATCRPSAMADTGRCPAESTWTTTRESGGSATGESRGRCGQIGVTSIAGIRGCRGVPPAEKL